MFEPGCIVSVSENGDCLVTVHLSTINGNLNVRALYIDLDEVIQTHTNVRLAGLFKEFTKDYVVHGVLPWTE